MLTNVWIYVRLCTCMCGSVLSMLPRRVLMCSKHKRSATWRFCWAKIRKKKDAKSEQTLPRFLRPPLHQCKSHQFASRTGRCCRPCPPAESLVRRQACGLRVPLQLWDTQRSAPWLLPLPQQMQGRARSKAKNTVPTPNLRVKQKSTVCSNALKS